MLIYEDLSLKAADASTSTMTEETFESFILESLRVLGKSLGIYLWQCDGI